ncbi:unnamed protein product [Plutella xylostella]|uniref:(diamondback moth) hypothetical protein n=1 Tax=Plutella xylostella TaxID=51655 RepID=A0A8S4GA23_PLUXY|nr:unnamed protein product [Plutella xylostella]
MLNFKHAQSNKTLGLKWNPCTDEFTFEHNINEQAKNADKQITKRSLLSDMSKLYDPLGWLSPVTVKAKILFQHIWTINRNNWDEPLPATLQKEWLQFRSDMSHIEQIKILRWIGDMNSNVELHGFSDASEKAMSCVIYCKTTDVTGNIVIRMVAAKTKLAPLNKSVSLPRLELCAAQLLALLMKKVIESIDKPDVTKHGWTDSMVVLGWLQVDTSRWKTFVANRVREIVETMPASCWGHTRSEDNAADCASRGLSPSQLSSHALWWQGPTWLKTDENKTEKYTPEIKPPQLEMKTTKVASAMQTSS